VEDPYDIAVVGAGPAGSTVAYAAARRGLRVALIDRHTFPRDKACGDGIGPGAIAVAAQLGLDGLFANDIPVTAVTINGPDGTYIDTTPTEMGTAIHGYIVPRRDFDNRLLSAALKAGAADLTGHKFVGTSLNGHHRIIGIQAHDGTSRQITARLMIGADGANSVTRRVLGAAPSLSRHTGIAMRAYARTDAFNPGGSIGPRMLFSFTRDLLPSYAWLFPTGRGTVNIGAGGPLSEFRGARQDLRDLLSTYSDQVRRRGIAFSDPIDHRAHHLPHFGGMPQLSYPRAALIGDAASMINPFSGEGIAYGMTAAALLSETLPDDITSPGILQDALAQFEHRFRSRFRAHMASTLLLHRLMRSPSWAKLFISAAQRDPEVLRDAVELLFGFGRVRALTSARILRTRWHRIPTSGN
jgi:geranylgeranyl reductase family protein